MQVAVGQRQAGEQGRDVGGGADPQAREHPPAGPGPVQRVRAPVEAEPVLDIGTGPATGQYGVEDDDAGAGPGRGGRGGEPGQARADDYYVTGCRCFFHALLTGQVRVS